MEIAMVVIPILSVAIVTLGVIIANLGLMVTRARTQTHLYETFLANQFKQESAFMHTCLNGTNDGSLTPVPSSQEESQSSMKTGQTLNL